MAEADPSSLGAATRLRERFTPELAAWALTQSELRRRAATKFPLADQMLFTRTGLEQATRSTVAAWRAERMRARGITTVVDLGCGIGSDAMAMTAAGLKVIAVDADEETVRCATSNLALMGGAPAIHARAEDLELPPDAAVFLDPARRNATGRSWNLDDYSPSWNFVRDLLATQRHVVVKLGPGFDKQYIPDDVQACFVSHTGDVVEVSLWNHTEPTGPRAVVMEREGTTRVVDTTSARSPLEVAAVGHYLSEPDNAVIRAGLIDAVAPELPRWLLADGVAYLSSDEPIDSPLATTFEILEVLPLDVRIVRAALRDRGIGTTEIKVRALDIDPATFRQQLKLKGSGSATLILARTVEGARALLARRR